jgi:prevent-host-death family protein
MTSVGAFEAKTNLNALLRRVAKGEVIQITRRGVPVAKLVPVEHIDQQTVRDVVREIRESRKEMTLGGISIRELIDEGRR